MSLLASERLYNLLPAIYRIRDASQNEALRALLGVIETERQAIEGDTDGLYADWFIETCAEWVVPYIGDLLGVRGLHAGSSGTFSLRAYVANTLAYRRRKGTATMLEQLARDVTGWDARVVEFFELLGTTQYLNHLRPENFRTPDLRQALALELVDTAFDQAAHTLDVRHISNGRGRHNIPNIGIYLWRLQAYALSRSHPCEQGAGFYTFNPLGLDQPLFNRPQTEVEITHLAEEINVADRLRRRPLYAETEMARRTLAGFSGPTPSYLGNQQPVFQIFVDGSSPPIPSERILICDLSIWRHPPTNKSYNQPDGTPIVLPIDVAVDPVLGRLAFPSGVVHDPIHVSYAYGFSGDVGGGPYNRNDSANQALKDRVTWQVGVSQNSPPLPNQIFATLADAVQAWNAQPSGTVGVIAILDSSTYAEDLTGSNVIEIPDGSQLLLVAADWPEVIDPDSLVASRQVGMFSADRLRPHLKGNLSVRGTASANNPNPGELVVNGLLIEGKLTGLVGNLGSLKVVHSTLSPDEGGLSINSGAAGLENARLALTLERSICGSINLTEQVPSLTIAEAVVDAVGAGEAIAASGAEASIRESTILGPMGVRSLDGSNSIFTGRVEVERRQVGCLRFSFTPDDSQTPRRFRCQPDLALEARAQDLGLESTANLSANERTLIINGVKPEFASEHYGDPEYAQLSRSCAREISTGAEDGAEMGVFHHLRQPQRESNLRESLSEYLRFGLEAGILFVT